MLDISIVNVSVVLVVAVVDCIMEVFSISDVVDVYGITVERIVVLLTTHIVVFPLISFVDNPFLIIVTVPLIFVVVCPLIIVVTFSPVLGNLLDEATISTVLGAGVIVVNVKIVVEVTKLIHSCIDKM